ncbi:MAG: C69 family dipeptidase, partial [Candidatus Helarchaeota archaeon]
MCDTIIVLGNSTEDGSTIFAKNSDREPNEAQGIVYYRRCEYKKGATVKCTYIEIPQVSVTYDVLLSVPYWIWGAEMGANEWGVCIGNEAVFSKLPYKEKGLLGMDLLRLALERSKTAEEALNTITSLLEEYGQGGSASVKDPSYIYHNSFIIADPKEAWVLETADKLWVAEKVKDIRTISNGYTIKKWDKASPNIIEYAVENGLCESKDDFDFVKCFSDPVPRAASNCEERQKITTDYLLDNKGNINVEMVMNLLRSHGKFDNKNSFDPSKSGMQICMHYSAKALSQTANSMVSHLSDLHTHWFTCTSAPCISLFKPFYIMYDAIPESYKVPGAKYDKNSLWWRHEKLHREVLKDYNTRAPIVKDYYKKAEKEFLEKAYELLKEFKNISNARERRDMMEDPQYYNGLKNLTTSALDKQYKLLEELIPKVSKTEPVNKVSKVYLKKWQKLS